MIGGRSCPDASPTRGRSRGDLGDAAGDPDHAGVDLWDGQARRQGIRHQPRSWWTEAELDDRVANPVIQMRYSRSGVSRPRLLRAATLKHVDLRCRDELRAHAGRPHIDAMPRRPNQPATTENHRPIGSAPTRKAADSPLVPGQIAMREPSARYMASAPPVFTTGSSEKSKPTTDATFCKPLAQTVSEAVVTSYRIRFPSRSTVQSPPL